MRVESRVRYGVVMPYSSNIDRRGNPYLSVYSSGAVDVAHRLYVDHKIDKFVLCGETTFGKGKKTTTVLMQEKLHELGVRDEDIVVTPGKKLDNSAIQLRAVSRFRRRGGLGSEPLTVITWGFHDERVRNHMKGFRLTGETVTVNSVLERAGVLTQAALDAMETPHLGTEKMLRRLSRIDTRGIVPTLLSFMRTPRVMDYIDGEPINTTAKKRRRQVATNREKVVV